MTMRSAHDTWPRGCVENSRCVARNGMASEGTPARVNAPETLQVYICG